MPEGWSPSDTYFGNLMDNLYPESSHISHQVFMEGKNQPSFIEHLGNSGCF